MAPTEMNEKMLSTYGGIGMRTFFSKQIVYHVMERFEQNQKREKDKMAKGMLVMGLTATTKELICVS